MNCQQCGAQREAPEGVCGQCGAPVPPAAPSLSRPNLEKSPRITAPLPAPVTPQAPLPVTPPLPQAPTAAPIAAGEQTSAWSAPLPPPPVAPPPIPPVAGAAPPTWSGALPPPPVVNPPWAGPDLPGQATGGGRGPRPVFLAVAVLVLAIAGVLTWWLLGSRDRGADATPAQSSLPSAAASARRSTPAPVVTVTATPTVRPAPTAPRASVPPTPDLATVRSLPTGSYLTVLKSLPQAEATEAEAWAWAPTFSRGGRSVVVVDSSSIPGLRAGYWALAVTGSATADEARAVCAALGLDLGGDCYERQVK